MSTAQILANQQMHSLKLCKVILSVVFALRETPSINTSPNFSCVVLRKIVSHILKSAVLIPSTHFTHIVRKTGILRSIFLWNLPIIYPPPPSP